MHKRPCYCREGIKTRLPLLFSDMSTFSGVGLLTPESLNSPTSLPGKQKREQSFLKYLPKSSMNCGCKPNAGGPTGKWGEIKEFQGIAESELPVPTLPSRQNHTAKTARGLPLPKEGYQTSPSSIK